MSVFLHFFVSLITSVFLVFKEATDVRNDLRQGVLKDMKENIKPNYAALGRQYNADYRTIKKVVEEITTDQVKTRKVVKKPSLLEPFKAIIHDKLALNCSAMVIFKFIQKKGYLGSYSTVKTYCRKFKNHEVKKATIRVTHTPGLSAQVDWKEEMKLRNSEGILYKFNIFLYVLPYSKYKYLTLTFDRSQDTLFSCLAQAFEATGGIPHEIWFDNMKTVIGHSKSSFGHAIFNQRFYQFSKDDAFKPIACRVFRPQTKALARTVERLRPYNYEPFDGTDLIELVDNLSDELNQEISQVTQLQPTLLWEDKEREHLHSTPVDLLKPYFEEDISRIVSKEAMVNFRKCKYSVDSKYIGEQVTLEVSDDEKHVQIYYNRKLIRSHEITTQQYNYNYEDTKAILRSDLMNGRNEDDIEQFISKNLSAYDQV